MACPLFEPTRKMPWTRWEGRFRPPLGAPYQGLCHAGAEPSTPPEASLTDCCNMGYARGRCALFVAPEADAVRLEIRGYSADSATVRWLSERNCLPVETGTVLLDRIDGRWRCRDEIAPLLRRQIEAFIEAHSEPGEDS